MVDCSKMLRMQRAWGVYTFNVASQGTHVGANSAHPSSIPQPRLFVLAITSLQHCPWSTIIRGLTINVSTLIYLESIETLLFLLNRNRQPLSWWSTNKFQNSCSAGFQPSDYRYEHCQIPVCDNIKSNFSKQSFSLEICNWLLGRFKSIQISVQQSNAFRKSLIGEISIWLICIFLYDMWLYMIGDDWWYWLVIFDSVSLWLVILSPITQIVTAKWSPGSAVKTRG
jgi:hypothetical protein